MKRLKLTLPAYVALFCTYEKLVLNHKQWPTVVDEFLTFGITSVMISLARERLIPKVIISIMKWVLSVPFYPPLQWCLIHKADVIPLWDNQYTLDILVFHYSEYCFFFFFFSWQTGTINFFTKWLFCYAIAEIKKPASNSKLIFWSEKQTRHDSD